MTIDEAVNFFGNQSRLAEALGVKPNAISNWHARGGLVPLPIQWQLELGTKGKLKADEPALLKPTRK
jgi:transcriptional repressor of cell division inhibition gene dicB